MKDSVSLRYHRNPRPGKLSIVASKPCETQDDLSLAYTPGVAEPCLAIKSEPATVFDYTFKGNAVAVVSDGTAVLGLGNIGAEAAMPVMEGKCVLFKRFADIDAMPLCLRNVYGADGRTDADKLIELVMALEPGFGGINLEDIGAGLLQSRAGAEKRVGIPVFHDDQHGTAIISLAALQMRLSSPAKALGFADGSERCRVQPAWPARAYISAGVLPRTSWFVTARG